MKRQINLLRITLWWGIIADAIETVRMLVPGLLKASMGLNLPQESGLQFGLLYGMPVMLGWVLVLFWADRKPLERRGVLLCLVPVILAYIGVEVFAISRGWVSLAAMLLPFALQSVLLGLSVVSYILTQ